MTAQTKNPFTIIMKTKHEKIIMALANSSQEKTLGGQ